MAYINNNYNVLIHSEYSKNKILDIKKLPSGIGIANSIYSDPLDKSLRIGMKSSGNLNMHILRIETASGLKKTYQTYYNSGSSKNGNVLGFLDVGDNIHDFVDVNTDHSGSMQCGVAKLKKKTGEVVALKTLQDTSYNS